LAKPNHQFEKRQRELAKQKKKEEKRLRKLEKPDGETDEAQDGGIEGEANADADAEGAEGDVAAETTGDNT